MGGNGHDRVWYVAYGSNMRQARFRCYLAGGRPDGGKRHYTGCRDPADPVAVRPVEVAGGLYFAGESAVWGGGVAAIDPTVDAVVAGRAYLITAGQFSDVASQESRRPTGLHIDVRAIAATGHAHLGGVRYQTVHYLGELDGLPMLTFTADDHAAAPLAPPSAPYLWSIASGLRETHSWSPGRIGAYLAAAPGAAGSWSPEQVAVLARQTAEQLSRGKPTSYPASGRPDQA